MGHEQCSGSNWSCSTPEARPSYFLNAEPHDACFPGWLVGAGAVSGSVSCPALFQILGVALSHLRCWSVLYWGRRETLCGSLRGSFLPGMSSQRALGTLTALVSLDFHLCLTNSPGESTRLHHRSLSLWPGNSKQWAGPGLLMYFIWVFGCLRWEDMVPVTPSCPEIED